MTSKPEQLSNTSVSDGSTVITGSTVDNTSASKVCFRSFFGNFFSKQKNVFILCYFVSVPTDFHISYLKNSFYPETLFLFFAKLTSCA